MPILVLSGMAVRTITSVPIARTVIAVIDMNTISFTNCTLLYQASHRLNTTSYWPGTSGQILHNFTFTNVPHWAGAHSWCDRELRQFWRGDCPCFDGVISSSFVTTYTCMLYVDSPRPCFDGVVHRCCEDHLVLWLMLPCPCHTPHTVLMSYTGYIDPRSCLSNQGNHLQV